MRRGSLARPTEPQRSNAAARAQATRRDRPLRALLSPIRVPSTLMTKLYPAAALGAVKDAANVMRQASPACSGARFFFFDGDGWRPHESNPLHSGYRRTRSLSTTMPTSMEDLRWRLPG